MSQDIMLGKDCWKRMLWVAVAGWVMTATSQWHRR